LLPIKIQQISATILCRICITCIIDHTCGIDRFNTRVRCPATQGLQRCPRLQERFGTGHGASSSIW
jgi:hypothetical protein